MDPEEMGPGNISFGKYLISRDHYVALLNSTLKKTIMLRGSMVLEVHDFLEDLPA
jgi:hypothetical protein